MVVNLLLAKLQNNSSLGGNMFRQVVRFLAASFILLTGIALYGEGVNLAPLSFDELANGSFFPAALPWDFSLYYLSLLLGMLGFGFVVRLIHLIGPFEWGATFQTFSLFGLLERFIVSGTVLISTLAAGSFLQVLIYFTNPKALIENFSPYHAAFFSAVCILFVGCATHVFIEGPRKLPSDEKKEFWPTLFSVFIKIFVQTLAVFILSVPFTKDFIFDLLAKGFLYMCPLHMSFGLGLLLPSLSDVFFGQMYERNGVWRAVRRWVQALSGWIFLMGAIFFAKTFSETVYFPSTVWSLCLVSYLTSFCLFCSKEFANPLVSWAWIIIAILVVVAFFVFERNELFVQNIGIHPVHEQLSFVFP
ncbi:hypothetical protein [Candidatus Similichlamydia epinepheli]|uniref:hypothetical protein n=1 Tax=Candidatus Similichlamydia epinepheli TaxID=1903953 RepID=UPI0013005A58|nr:hypothetical protein [Candidatus Similichlamydia epinepheli]